jgi:hypothetical protein
VAGVIEVPSIDSDGVFFSLVMHAPQNAAKVDKAFRDEVTRFARDGITRAELDRAKTALSQQVKTDRGDDESLVALLKEDLFLNRTMAYHDSVERAIRALTVAEVNAAIARRVHPEQLSYFKVGDFSVRAASSAAKADSDTLTLDVAKRVATLAKQIDSAAAAEHIPEVPAHPDSEEVAAQTKWIKGSPALTGVVTRAGFTVDDYARLDARIEIAIAYDALAKAMAARGIPAESAEGFTKPSAADLAFVRAHASELKQFGFDTPTIEMQAGHP